MKLAKPSGIGEELLSTGYPVSLDDEKKHARLQINLNSIEFKIWYVQWGNMLVNRKLFTKCEANVENMKKSVGEFFLETSPGVN